MSNRVEEHPSPLLARWAYITSATNFLMCPCSLKTSQATTARLVYFISILHYFCFKLHRQFPANLKLIFVNRLCHVQRFFNIIVHERTMLVSHYPVGLAVAEYVRRVSAHD